jgi:DNA-directed RNA polymerase subunit RPC12/RpoP
MAGPVPQSGALVPCPSCGVEVMQKAMIPVGETPSDGDIKGVPHYLCVACARKLVKTT